MNDSQKLLRIYVADPGIQVMGLVGAVGCALAFSEPQLSTLWACWRWGGACTCSKST